MKNAQKQLLLFKIETTEGTDAVPVVATNAIITRNLDSSKFDADKGTRNLDGLYAGARPSYYKQIRNPTTFEVEISGSGTTATAIPAWMAINRICGWDGGVAGASSVVNSLIHPFTAPSGTLYPYWDNLLISSLGTRGNMKMTFADDDIPYFGYDLLGFPPPAIAVESAPGNPTYGLQAAPVLVNTANTTFSLGGYSPGLKQLDLDLGVKPTPRSLTGPIDRILLPDREVTGTVLIEHPDLTSKNYFTNMVSRGTVPLQVIHGTVAGNIVQVDAARCEIDLSTQSKGDGGGLMQSLPIRLLPTTAGNDELTLTTK